jgi:uncharacterized repeat protein (TIGR01451 family)
VGTAGSIYHYDGTSWSQVDSPTNNLLRAVQMVNADDGWIVGDNGTILHYHGGAWQLASSPTTKELLAVSMVSSGSGWATGTNGAFLRYTGAPDLSTSAKAVTPRHASPGEELTYTIDVRNSGTAAAPSVGLTDPTPQGTTYVPGSATTTRGTIQGTNPLVVAIGNLGPGEEATVEFRVLVQDLGLPCWFAVNDAQISSGGVLSRRAVTTIGAGCLRAYLPLVYRDNP